MRYFVAVAEYLNFNRAAEALMTAQPSLSRQIMQLEDEIGVKLFERTNRRVALTTAGRTFLEDARRTLAAADASLKHARESADGTRGELRLAFVGGAMMMALPLVLREYRRRFPDVTVIPHAMHYPEHIPALRAGTIDVAWTLALPDPEITSRTIESGDLLVVVPIDHAFAKRKKIDVGAFSDESLVVISRDVSPLLYDETMSLCLRHGFRPKHIHPVLEEVTVLGLVAAGFGVAIVPRPWSVINIAGIVFRPNADDFSFPESLSWHNDRNTAIVQAFVQTTLELLQRKVR